MEKKLLIYIVSYERMNYTIGTIKSIFSVAPSNSQIIVCDNGSTDGTREWLEENQEKYNLGLLFPEENLRVGGAWTLLTKYFKEDDFDFILLLDNDCWIKPDKEWFKICMEIFDKDPNRCSLGLLKEQIAGTFSIKTLPDPNYKNVQKYKGQEYFDTVFYAAARLDKFNIWHQTMVNWPHKYIGDKIGRHYNSLGYKATKLHPGYIFDISEYDVANPKYQEYNEWFFKKEKTLETLRIKEEKAKRMTNINDIKEIFPTEIYKLLNN